MLPSHIPYRGTLRARALRVLLSTLIAIAVGVVAVLLGVSPLVAGVVGGTAGGGSLIVAANIQERRAAHRQKSGDSKAAAVSSSAWAPARSQSYFTFPLGCVVLLAVLMYFVWRHC